MVLQGKITSPRQRLLGLLELAPKTRLNIYKALFSRTLVVRNMDGHWLAIRANQLVTDSRPHDAKDAEACDAVQLFLAC